MPAPRRRRLHQDAGTLTNDFFVNLLDMGNVWKATSAAEDVFELRDRKTNALKWTATASISCSDRIRSSAPGEVYGSSDGKAKFVSDFVAAWNKVMNLDRFDLA